MIILERNHIKKENMYLNIQKWNLFPLKLCFNVSNCKPVVHSRLQPVLLWQERVSEKYLGFLRLLIHCSLANMELGHSQFDHWSLGAVRSSWQSHCRARKHNIEARQSPHAKPYGSSASWRIWAFPLRIPFASSATIWEKLTWLLKLMSFHRNIENSTCFCSCNCWRNNLLYFNSNYAKFFFQYFRYKGFSWTQPDTMKFCSTGNICSQNKVSKFHLNWTAC